MDNEQNSKRKYPSNPEGTSFVTVTLPRELGDKLTLICTTNEVSKNAVFVSMLAMLAERDIMELYEKACDAGVVRRQGKKGPPPLTARDVSRQLRALTPEQLAALAAQIETMTTGQAETTS